MPEQKTIRVGLLCNGTSLPYWQAQAVRHIIENPAVRLVVMGTPGPDREHPERRGFRGYLDHRIQQLLAPIAATPVDLAEPLALIPAVELGRNGELGALIKALDVHSLDLVLSFLPPMEHLQRKAVNEPEVWQYCLNGSGIGLEGMPMMSPIFASETQLMAEFIQVNGSGVVKAEFPLRTLDDRSSLDPWLMGAAWLPAKVISDMIRGNVAQGPSAQAPVQDPGMSIGMVPLIHTWLTLEFRKIVAPKEPSRDHDPWNIGILHQPITALLEDDPSMNVRWLPAPSDGNHRMEPFGFTAPDGQLNVLYRKRSMHNIHDSIAKLRPKSDSVLKRSRTMLSTEASLSYPFVVERPEGAFAVIGYPHQSRTELFKVSATNDGLDHIKVLLNSALTNPTMTEYEGRWWLFGTDPEASSSVLLAYYSDAFDGPYTPHTLNPLQVDAQGCRPAGTFFRRGEELWRPANDISEPGVRAVVLNRVLALTPHNFKEEPGKRINGFRGSVYGNGLRTLSAMGDITLIDGVRSGGGEVARPKKRTSREKSHRSKRK